MSAPLHTRQEQINEIRRVHGDIVADGYMTPEELNKREFKTDGLVHGQSLCESIGLAQVRKLNAEAALLEGQAAHQHAEAVQVLAQAAMQRFNVEVMAPLQQKMQDNTLRLQTVQIDRDVSLAVAQLQSAKNAGRGVS